MKKVSALKRTNEQENASRKKTHVIVPATHSFLTSTGLPSFPVGTRISSVATLIATNINRLASANSRPGQARLPKPNTYSLTSRLGPVVDA
jgi:hypothetical protein